MSSPFYLSGDVLLSFNYNLGSQHLYKSNRGSRKEERISCFKGDKNFETLSTIYITHSALKLNKGIPCQKRKMVFSSMLNIYHIPISHAFLINIRTNCQ